MENHLFISTCLLLAVAGSCIEATPVPSTRQDPDGPQDVRWKLVTGLEVAYLFTNQLNHLQSCEPLLNVTGALETILSGICHLLEIQEELTAHVENGGDDLHVVLEQNVLDSCRWLNYLVTVPLTEGGVSASDRFLGLGETCEVGDTPRLSQYCLESRRPSFYNNFYNDIFQPAGDYYSGTVVNQEIQRWLNSSLPTDSVNSIETALKSNQTMSC